MIWLCYHRGGSVYTFSSFQKRTNTLSACSSCFGKSRLNPASQNFGLYLVLRELQLEWRHSPALQIAFGGDTAALVSDTPVWCGAFEQNIQTTHGPAMLTLLFVWTCGCLKAEPVFDVNCNPILFILAFHKWPSTKQNLLKIWDLAVVTSFENQLQAFSLLKSCPREDDSNKTVSGYT